MWVCLGRNLWCTHHKIKQTLLHPSDVFLVPDRELFRVLVNSFHRVLEVCLASKERRLPVAKSTCCPIKSIIVFTWSYETWREELGLSVMSFTKRRYSLLAYHNEDILYYYIVGIPKHKVLNFFNSRYTTNSTGPLCMTIGHRLRLPQTTQHRLLTLDADTCHNNKD